MFRVAVVAPSQSSIVHYGKSRNSTSDSIAIIEADMLHFAFWPARPCGRAEHP
jgi:hypothetical protein